MTFMSLKVINRTVAIVALLVIAICIIYGASELQGMGILVLIGYVVAIAPFIVTTFFPFFKKTKRNTIIGIVVIAIFLSFSVYCLLRYDLCAFALCCSNNNCIVLQ